MESEKMIARPLPQSLLRVLGIAALAVAAGGAATPARSEDIAGGKTVADGVYSDAQATRGQAFYEASCTGCHRADLSGAEGPELRGDHFSKDFAGKDLKSLYGKIVTTMPGTAPASLSNNVYLDIVAHLLRENGFPAGPNELTSESVAGVRIVAGRARPLPPVEDFSYVEAVGCMTSGTGSGSSKVWLLTRASDPVSARPEQPAGAPRLDKPLGSRTLRLLDARAYNPQSHEGQKVYVRGLLVKLSQDEQMTLSALETVAGTCGGS